MTRIENFQFNHVVLFAKGWYEGTGKMFADLEKYIRLNDDYCYQQKPFSEELVADYMLKALDIVLSHLTKEERENHYLGTHRKLYSYVNNRARFYNTNYNTALVYVIYACLQGLERSQIKLPQPIYKRGNPRIGWQNKTGMTYKEMNRIAAKYQWN